METIRVRGQFFPAPTLCRLNSPITNVHSNARTLRCCAPAASCGRSPCRLRFDLRLSPSGIYVTPQDIPYHFIMLTSNPASRTFTSLAPLRPSMFPTSTALAMPTGITSITTATATIAPRISLHPALRSLQVRNGPRNTFDPSHRVRKRRAGFLARKKTRGGRAVLKRRQLKGRKSLSH